MSVIVLSTYILYLGTTVTCTLHVPDFMVCRSLRADDVVPMYIPNFQLTAMFMHLTNTSTRELGCPSSTSLNGLSVHSVKSIFATTTTSTPTHLRKHDRNANAHKGHNNAPRSPNRCTRPHHSVSRCSKLSEPYVHMSSTAQP